MIDVYRQEEERKKIKTGTEKESENRYGIYKDQMKDLGYWKLREGIEE